MGKLGQAKLARLGERSSQAKLASNNGNIRPTQAGLVRQSWQGLGKAKPVNCS